MSATRSIFVAITMVAAFLGVFVATGDTPALGQIGITVDQTSVYAAPASKELRRVLDPGVTVDVSEAQGNWLKIAVSRNNQTLDGWIEAKNLLALDPRIPYHRALASQGSGEAEQAIEAYTEAIAADPTNARAYYNRALLYRERNDASRVIADCTAAVKINPEFAEAYLTRGNAYASQDAFDAACRDYETAIRLRPNYALAFFNRSLIKDRRSTELFAEKPARAREAGELGDQAADDFDRAKRLELPPLIAKRVASIPQFENLIDIPSAVEAGYIRMYATGSEAVSMMGTESLYGLSLGARIVVPMKRVPSLSIPIGTQFTSMGPHQNMVTCDSSTLYPKPQPTSIKDLFIYQYKDEIPAAGLDFDRQPARSSDRFVGVTPADENVQKFLVYCDYAEIYERAAIMLSDRGQGQDAKKKMYYDDPASLADFHRKVREAGVLAINDDLTATAIADRIPEIGPLHAMVAAKILDLADIPNSLGVRPIEIRDLMPEELAKILDSTTKIPFKDLAVEKMEVLELAKKRVDSQDPLLQENATSTLTSAEATKAWDLTKQKNPVLDALSQARSPQDKATLALILALASMTMGPNDVYDSSVSLKHSIKILTPKEQEFLANAIDIPAKELIDSPSQGFSSTALAPANRALAAAQTREAELREQVARDNPELRKTIKRIAGLTQQTEQLSAEARKHGKRAAELQQQVEAKLAEFKELEKRAAEMKKLADKAPAEMIEQGSWKAAEAANEARAIGKLFDEEKTAAETLAQQGKTISESLYQQQRSLWEALTQEKKRLAESILREEHLLLKLREEKTGVRPESIDNSKRQIARWQEQKRHIAEWQEQILLIPELQYRLQSLQQQFAKQRDADMALAPKFSALARKQLALTQTDLGAVKTFLKELAGKKRLNEEAAKTTWEELAPDDREKLAEVMVILGPQQYNLNLAASFAKLLTAEEKELLVAAQKVIDLARNSFRDLPTEEKTAMLKGASADATEEQKRALVDSWFRDLTDEEKNALKTSQSNLDLAVILLTVLRYPLDQSLADEIVRRADSQFARSLSRRRVESVADGVEASIVNFRRWIPGKTRWDGVYFVDKNQKAVAWKLDNRVPLVSDPMPMQAENSRTVSAPSVVDDVQASFGDSKFGRRVAALPKPVGRFVEVTVRFRNKGKAPAAVQFCTPTSVYAGAYLKLVDYPKPGDEFGVVPVDFVLPGVALAPEAAETTKGLTLISDLSLSAAGSLGFELAAQQETCALFLFDVPNDAGNFQLVIMGKTIDLGLPHDPTSFEPADDKIIP